MLQKAPPGGRVLTTGIVDVLFALLDVNGDGRLDQEEFMTLMKRQSAVPDPVSETHTYTSRRERKLLVFQR